MVGLAKAHPNHNFFFLYLFVIFFGNNYDIGELTSAVSKERITTNIIFAGALPIN